jgi:Txe/YoeB family toxin of Txe-Axe toxin-antitoxin module
MINTEPSDITEARGLLRDFERIEDHSVRVKKFEDALELLDSYLSDHEKPEQLAINLQRTYTRKILEQLPSLKYLDINDWFLYALLLLTKLQKDVDYICTENEQLKKKFDEFISIWADEVIKLLQHRITKK